MAVMTDLYINIIFAFYTYVCLFHPFPLSSLLNWMLENGCMNTCCSVCHILNDCVLYTGFLYLFSATDHVSHRKALSKKTQQSLYTLQSPYFSNHY